MKISWEWLSSFIDLKGKSPIKVSDQLILAGCEIEEIEEVIVLDKKDYILDITSTPNRSDLQGVVGIAKEVCAILNLDQNYISEMENNIILTEKNLKVINHKNDTSIFSLPNSHCCISKLSNKPIPDLIKMRLKASGIKVQDNINDISNYIMLKWGQPIEIVNISADSELKPKDITFVKENRVKIAPNKPNNDKTEVVITKHKNVTVALTAIETKSDHRATKVSSNICLQVIIVPINIVRKNSKYSNIRNESSIRYERGLNKASLKLALLDTILLIKKTYPEALVGDIYNNISERSNLKNSSIRLDMNKVKSILGKVDINNSIQNIESEKVQKILSSLGCSVINFDTFLEVMVPESRKNDLCREIDLIEEIARIQGFNTFKAILPEFTHLKTSSNRNNTIKEFVKKLRSLGMTEVIHYSLASQAYNEKIKVENPLLSEYSSLRTSLLTNLIDSFESNIKKGNDNFDTFEIGRVFEKRKEINTSHEQEVVGGIFGGRLTRKSWQSALQSMNWFEAKGVIELLLGSMVQKAEWRNEIKNQYTRILHPKRSSSIFLRNKYFGSFGEVHPQIATVKNMPNGIYCFELNLVMLIENLQGKNYTHRFQHYSSFPSIIRDVAVIVPLEVNFESITKIINNQDYSILKNIQLFDEYKGKNIEKGKKSVAFRLIYQSTLKTLTTSEVDSIQKEIKNKLKEELNTEFR